MTTLKRSLTKKRRTFSKKDTLSGDGMLTTVWGPSLWHALHTMSFNYPVKPTVEQKKEYRAFMLSLVHVLPCKYCRENLRKNFKKLPLTVADMKDRTTFSKYVYNLHELINTMLKKKSGLTYCDVRERYEHFRARCTLDDPKKKEEEKEKEKEKDKDKGKEEDKDKTVEKGCTEPLYGKKAKGVILIMPQEKKCPTFQMDEACFKKRECEKN